MKGRGEEDKIAIEGTEVLDIQTVVHKDAVFARKAVLDQFLIAIE